MSKYTIKEWEVILLLILFGLFAIPNIIWSQSYTRSGNTFKAKRSVKAKQDTILTAYIYEDANGLCYPIIVNTKGKCWIWKKSSKTGKMYRYYLKGEIVETIKKEMKL